ncbi:GGDEF domain-containing protein [Ciceribacter sp. L1K23]|uniref:GGDEF domain-containing protein n=1 Tax=Ciceribacter sp. L1K23 TaxID=2820276 RepID=UPI001B82091E|nr:GGDEF domain-containing protein [Ciceribacter sp. L1K23]MBR0556823.1 GGDEF domain-containing protein [Ciceribacter sp. L1K23]
MLDLSTVFLYTALLNLAVAIATTVGWLSNHRQKELLIWCLAAWSIVVGGMMMAMPKTVGLQAIEYIGGIVYICMAGLLALGFKEFFGLRYRWWEAFVVSLVVSICRVGLKVMDFPISAHVPLIYLGTAANLVFAATVIHRATRGRKLPSSRLAVVVYSLFAFANAVVAAIAAVSPLRIEDGLPVASWLGPTSILLAIFTLSAFLLTIVLKLERVSEDHRRLADTDYLTGILNRRRFMEEAELLSRTTGGAIALIDIDHFKRINDTHGHAGGDDALVQFCEHVVSAMPANAVFGRLGGEEFGLCLPRHDHAAATIVLEHLRSAIATREIRSGKSAFYLTFSCGFTVMDRDDRALDAWVVEADQSLYVAKTEGRNRVVATPVNREPSTPTHVYSRTA